MKTKKLFLLMMTILLIINMTNLPLFAEEQEKVRELTLEEFIRMAIDNSTEMKKMSNTIKYLWKQENADMAESNSIQDYLDKLDRYDKLYEKRQNGITLSISDQDDLLLYSEMFGETPPHYSNEELFNKYIKNRDFPHYSTWVEAQNTKTKQDVLKLTIEVKTRQLYDSVIKENGILALNQSTMKMMEKEYADLENKFKQGIVPQNDWYQAGIKLNQQRLLVENQTTVVQNANLRLKKQCGIPFSQSINLRPSSSLRIESQDTYKHYLDNALMNRNEIVIAKLNLSVKQREFDIMKKYITNTLNSDYMQLVAQLEDYKISLKQSNEDVTKELNRLYLDIQLRQKDFEIAVSTKNNEEYKFHNTTRRYELGQVNMLALWSEKATLYKANIDLISAKADLDYSIYKIKLASSLGTQKSEGGL